MHERQWLLPGKGRPDLGRKDPLDLLDFWQWHEEGLSEAQSPLTLLVDQLESCDIDLIGAHLAVADGPVSGILKARKFEGVYPHLDHPKGSRALHATRMWGVTCNGPGSSDGRGATG